MSLAIIGTVATVASVGMAAAKMAMAPGAGGMGQVTESAQGKTAANIAAEQYNNYLKDMKPTEEKFIADVMKPTTALEQKVQGQVNADINQKISSPADPTALNRSIANASKAGEAMGAAQVQGGLSAENSKLTALQAVTDIGEGKRSGAETAINGLAANADKAAMANASAKADKMSGLVNTIGSLAGAAGGLAKNWNSNSTPWNQSSGAIDNYNPQTDYSGAGEAGPWAAPDTSMSAIDSYNAPDTIDYGGDFGGGGMA